MKKIWVKKADSFKAAEKFDKDYYLGMSRSKRLETVQFLREMNFKIKRDFADEGGKGLRRTIKIIQQK